MSILTLHGNQVFIKETGVGAPLLFVHCSSTNHKEWNFLAEQMVKTYRCIQPDLIGYGQSSANWGDDGRLIGCTDEKLLEHIFSQLDQPVHIVAHSYGAAAVLEVAARFPERVASLCLFEPVSFHLLNRPETKRFWQQISRFGNRIIAAVEADNYTAAARHYMGFWIGHLKWTFAPKYFKRTVCKGMPKVANDFHVMYTRESSLSHFSKIQCPVTIVQGERSPKAVDATSDLLAKSMPACKKIVVSREGHMLPMLNQPKTRDIVNGHFTRLAS